MYLLDNKISIWGNFEHVKVMLDLDGLLHGNRPISALTPYEVTFFLKHSEIKILLYWWGMMYIWY